MATKPKTRPFDAAAYLDSPAMVAAYLTEAFATGDRAFIADAMSTVARSKGMAKIAEKTGSNRESLYRSFDGKTEPQFTTVQRVLDAMNFELLVKPKDAAAAGRYTTL